MTLSKVLISVSSLNLSLLILHKRTVVLNYCTVAGVTTGSFLCVTRKKTEIS